MKYYKGDSIGKVLLLELDRGEEFFSCVEKMLKEQGIQNAYIASAVGSIAHLEYHRPKDLGKVTDDEMVSLDGPFEFGSITGTVINGSAHFHFSAGGPNGNYVGHLERGTIVLYLLELLVIELNGFNLERKWTDEGVRKLSPKQ